MSLSSGQRLGPYEIIAPLGAGGMGEVYRARDTRLERDVAVKVLPRDFSESPQFRLRFQREAKTISQLSHPNICTLYDVGEHEGADFLVMELLEGETLADRLAKGPLALKDVLSIGSQIAEALDRAHRQQVVHRDLKPGNVMLTRSGAKLLDFGLAKPAGSVDANPTDATEQKPLTQEGTIVGTFQYMAPEQLESAEADARTDIFALGAVIYEMTTGRRAFDGKTKMSLIAAIMSSTPEPISTLQPVTPPALEHVVSRCLEKNPDDRWQSARDVAEELRWIGALGSQAGATVPRLKRRSFGWLLPALLLLLGLLAGAWGHRQYAVRHAPTPKPLRYVIEYGDMARSVPALSPDGRTVVYRKDGKLYKRDLGRLEAQEIPNTEGGDVPFWSPDGTWLGFSTNDGTFKIRLDGSSRTQICAMGFSGVSGGAVWTTDGRILFDTGSSPIYEVSERGGDPRVLVDMREGEADFHHLSLLPDGTSVLFVVHEGDLFNKVDIWDGAIRRTVLEIPDEGIGSPAFADTGHILFWRYTKRNGLWAVPFSIDRLETTGEPFPVAAGAAEPTSTGTTLVYTLAGPQSTTSEIVEVDRSGNVLRVIGPPRQGLAPSLALSPDERRIAAVIFTTRGNDLWLFDIEGGDPTQLTFHRDSEVSPPSWRPGSSEVVYSVNEGMGTYHLEGLVPGGSSRHLGPGGGPAALHGDDIVYPLHSAGYNFDLWRKKVDDSGKGEVIVGDPGWDLKPAISPDGKFIAYQKAGNMLVRTFPEGAGSWPAASGCTAPLWSRSGDRLFCLADDEIVEVPVTADAGTIRFGSPRRLFAFAQAPASEEVGPMLELGPGGETFLLVRPLERPPGIVVVHDWPQTIE